MEVQQQDLIVDCHVNVGYSYPYLFGNHKAYFIGFSLFIFIFKIGIYLGRNLEGHVGLPSPPQKILVPPLLFAKTTLGISCLVIHKRVKWKFDARGKTQILL